MERIMSIKTSDIFLMKFANANYESMTDGEKNEFKNLMTEIISVLQHGGIVSRDFTQDRQLPLYQRLMLTRKSLSMSRRKVSDLTGISERIIVAYESGEVKYPRADVLVRLAKVYNIPYASLI